MIDWHSHILPGLDDGSKDIEESLALLQLLDRQGIDAVIATPHFYAEQESPQEFLLRRKKASEQLKNAEVLLGAEYRGYRTVIRCGCRNFRNCRDNGRIKRRGQSNL